jgi:hypothetical protein
VNWNEPDHDIHIHTCTELVVCDCLPSPHVDRLGVATDEFKQSAENLCSPKKVALLSPLSTIVVLFLRKFVSVHKMVVRRSPGAVCTEYVWGRRGLLGYRPIAHRITTSIFLIVHLLVSRGIWGIKHDVINEEYDSLRNTSVTTGDNSR